MAKKWNQAGKIFAFDQQEEFACPECLVGTYMLSKTSLFGIIKSTVGMHATIAGDMKYF
jgi:hypothetical protein